MFRSSIATVITSLMLLAAIGCGTPDETATTNPNPGSDEQTHTSAANSETSSLAGNISIEGSSTVEPISNRAKEKFNAKFPNVSITVGGSGTGNGFKALGAKECDLSDASRPIKQKEQGLCDTSEVVFYEVPVAYDGLTIVVNKGNEFVKELTVEQLKLIFREDMAAKTWKDVDASWPEEKLSIYAPGIASGTHDYFVEVIGKKDKKGLRSDEQTMLSEDDKSLVTGVKGDKFSIGFFGFSYYAANEDELKAVPIVNPKTETAVTPSIASIESGEYAPFSRPLFIYVNSESYQRAEVKEFVDFYLDNIVDIVKDASYVPLPAEIYESAQSHILKDLSGTHYLDSEGNKREGSVTEVYQQKNLAE